MSIEAITAVKNLAPEHVSAAERIVLYVLAWHANRHGHDIWPAVRTIARESSLSRRGVQYLMPRLCEKGFAFIAGQKSRGGVIYGLNLELLHRARYSQSDTQDCEPNSQSAPIDRARGSQSVEISTAINSEPGAPGGEWDSPGGVHRVHRGGAPGAPELSLNCHSELSREEVPGADAPVPRALTNQDRENLRLQIERVVIDVLEDEFDSLPDFETLKTRTTERLERACIVCLDASLVSGVIALVHGQYRFGKRRRGKKTA